jgi:hypothetical protein
METWVQWAVGLGVTIVLALGGILTNSLNKLSQKQAADHAHLNGRIDQVQKEYVRRDDFKEFRDDVRNSLERIEEKQDRLINLSRTTPH